MEDVREARLELERFVNVWGLDRLTTKSGEEDSLSNGELLQMYLACSVLFVRWTLVYKALPDLSLSTDQLLQASRKAASSSDNSGDRSGFFGSRQPRALSQLCAGASFRQLAKDTTLFRELEEALAPAQFESPALLVMAFHLVGAHNLVAAVEDPHSLFVCNRIPVSRREASIEALRRLQLKWSGNNADQVSAEAALLICECDYPVLGTLGLGGSVLDEMHKRRSQASSGPIPIRAKTLASTRSAGVRLHTTQPWSSTSERRWADEPRFQRYKQVRGWMPFYPSRDTVLAYLSEMTRANSPVATDCRDMGSPELVQMAAQLAPHVESTLFAQTQQGKDFVRAMSATATLQQMGSWSTLDAAQRLIVAHHPDWQTHYAHAWGLDRTTSVEIAAYRERWPHLPEGLMAELGLE